MNIRCVGNVCFILHDIVEIKTSFFTSVNQSRYKPWSDQNTSEVLMCMYIKFFSKIYRKHFGNPMGSNCAPLIEGLFLFCFLVIG